MSKAQDNKELQRYLTKLKQIGDSGEVNYAETKEEKEARKKKAAKDYGYFVKYYFPHYAEFPCTDFQIEEANKVLKDKTIHVIEEWARGLAKSTHFDIFVPLWLHLFHDQLKCMVLVGKNYQSAKKLLSDLQAECAANQQLKHDFGQLVKQGSWEEGNFITATGAAFYALGKGQSPRGLRNGPYRPDFIVLDDADDDEECRNPKRVDDSTEWVLRALLPAMGSDTTRFVMVNNRIAPYCILSKLASNPAFKHRKVNALDENGNPAWAAKYSKEFYDDKRKKLGIPFFQTEYMNDPQIGGKVFMTEYFHFKKLPRLNQYQRIVAYWDIAYSEAKTADYNAIPIVGLYNQEKHVINAFCRQCSMPVAIQWMYNLQNSLPKTVIVEWYAESQFWNNAVELELQKMAKANGYRLSVIFLDRPGRGTNKYSRMMQMLPDFINGDVFFNQELEHNPDMQTGVRQIKAVEPGSSSHDDFPDALEGALNKLNFNLVNNDAVPIFGRNAPLKRIY